MRALGGATERLFGAGRRGLWRRRVARRLVSAALAAAAVLGCVGVARAPEGGPRATVVVAVRNLSAGHTLGPGDVVEQSRPAGFAPAQPLRAADQVSGRRLAGPVSAGEVLTQGRLLGRGLLAGRPAEEVAVHVAVADPGALAMLRPGDEIDLLLAATGDVVASAATVLALSSTDGDSSGVGLGAHSLTQDGVVLAVSPTVAARIATVPPDTLGGASLSVVLRHSDWLR